MKIILLISKYFMTPLHWASKRGHLKLIQLLIENHSDIDAEDLVNKIKLLTVILNFLLSKVRKDPFAFRNIRELGRSS